MTKLEELSTLIVNEIENFNKGISKLEAINQEISNTKIQMDLTEYKSIIERHQQSMNEHVNVLEQFESRFNNKIKQAKIYPNWAVILFILSILLCFGCLFYTYTEKLNIDNIAKTTYYKVVEKYDENLQAFFLRKSKCS